MAAILSVLCVSVCPKVLNENDYSYHNSIIIFQVTFSLGCLVGLVACIWLGLDESNSFQTWGVYVVAAMLGVGGSTLLITSLSFTADLIGDNIEGSAFVYGFMSLVDKVSNGIIFMVIQTVGDQPENQAEG